MSEEFWWKKAAFTYGVARKSHFVQNVHKAFLNQVDLLSLPKGLTALDAGCGDGNVTFPLADRGFSVTAIDFGEAVLEYGKRRGQSLGAENVEFEFGDLNQPLKYSDSSFDLVTSLHVLMKVKNIDLALKEFYRIIKPGGYAIISLTSSTESFDSWLKRYIKNNGLFKALWDIRWLVAWNLPYIMLTSKSDRKDEWRWTPEVLTQHMTEAGFTHKFAEDVPYIHVGCTLGVYQKPL